MRVTHVITRLIVGGAQENTVASVLGLRNKPGLEVELISGPTTGPEGSIEPLVATVPGCLTILPELIRPVRPFRDARAYVRLLKHFRCWQPALVHTHSGKAGFLGRLAARRAGVPLVVHTIHGPSFGPFQGRFANAAFTTAERMAGRVTDHFVVVAEAMTRQYLDAGIGRPEQYTRIFSGFDLEPFLTASRDPALAAQLGVRADDFVVGKIARLFERKGHDELMAMAPGLVQRIPNLRFLLVGDGPWRERLEQRAAEPDLRGRFIFAGLVSPAEVARYVGLFDVLVHLSRREGLARALPQALAAGKPVIACAGDGAGEVCLEGQTGFLIRPGDLDAFQDRLMRLYRDPALRHQMGKTGREFVRKRFGAGRMVDELHALYLRLAAPANRAIIPADPSSAPAA